MSTLRSYIQHANRPDLLGVAISCDLNDETMTRNLVQEELHRTLASTAWHKLFFSPNTSKIEACNANMSEIEWEWDIVVLVSDDMIPQIQGYDDAIRNHMTARFPDTDGILWFSDGLQGYNLNTLSIYGRTMYSRLGHIYRPEYKSLFCDTELTDLCKNTLADKCMYIPYCIIRHEHPATGFPQNMDALYDRNQRFFYQDMITYISRKTYTYDWSVLIATIPGREKSLQTLLTSIREKTSRICPSLRVEICLGFDNRETSIGSKRQKLLTDARGKYMSFIDDDDDITDAYVEDLWQTFTTGADVMRIRGQIKQYTFVHSLDVKLTDMMATRTVPPVFQRPPNHLNPMLTDIAKFIPFKNATRGEDLDWTIQLSKSNLLRKEYIPPEPRIQYVYNMGVREISPEAVTRQQTISYNTMLEGIFVSADAPKPVVHKQPGLRLGSKGFVSA
jgi:hypothetical protein